MAKAQQKAKEFVAELYGHVPVLDSRRRGATITFAKTTRRRAVGLGERGVTGACEWGPDKFEIVIPR